MIKTFAQLKKIAATSLTLAAILLTPEADATSGYLYTITQESGISITFNGVAYKLNSQTVAGAYPVFCVEGAFLSVDDNLSTTISVSVPVGMKFDGWYGLNNAKNIGLTTPLANYTILISADQEASLSDLRKAYCYATNKAPQLLLKYSIADYKVDFESQGGSKVSSITVRYQENYPKLPDSSLTGYKFLGWFTGKTGGKQIKAGDMVTSGLAKDHTLYAHWQANTYTATLNVNGGDLGERSVQLVYDQPYGDLPKPNRLGYEFLGWSYKGEIVKAEETFKVPSNIELKAEWAEIKYKLFIHSNYNGRHQEESDWIEFIPNASTYKISDASVYGFGYKELEFIGWSFNPSDSVSELGKQFEKTGSFLSKYVPEGENEAHIYALWNVLSYTVHFQSPEATGGTMTDQVIERETATKLTKNAFTRTGYVFVGWSSSVREKPFTDEEEVTNLAAVDQTVTLVAVWEAIKQKVSFDANWDGPAGSLVTTDVPEPIELKFGETKSIPTWTPVNTLADFLGWAYEADATEPDFTTEVKDLPAEAAITLYAVWAKKDTTLSQAVGCDNLILSSVAVIAPTKGDGDPWKVITGGIQSGVIYPSWSTGGFYQCYSEVTAVLPQAGRLVFRWYVRDINGGRSCFMVDSKEVSGVTATESEGSVVYTNAADGPVKVSWRAYGKNPSPQYEVPSNLVITSVRWYPEGVNPEPTEEDAPVITADYSFKTDSMFDYVIEAKNTLADAKWTTVNVVTGDGSAITLPMTPSAEQPQRFFRVRVIRRGTE